VKKIAKFWKFPKSVTFLYTFPKREWRLRLPQSSADAAVASAACTFFAMEPGFPFCPLCELAFFAMESLIRAGKCDCGEARLCYLI
jgi:hypothetical protein